MTALLIETIARPWDTAAHFKASSVQNFTLAEQILDAGTRLPTHAHRMSVLSLLLSGTYTERSGAVVHEHKAGSASFLPLMVEHAIAVGVRGTHCFNVEIPAHYTDRLRELDSRPLELLTDHGGSVAWLTTRLHEAVAARTPGGALVVEGLVLEILGCIARVRCADGDSVAPRWLPALDELLRQEFQQRLTIAELADRVGVHPVHLSRTWRRFRGCSIGEAVHRARIEAACRRLAEGAPSLADVALEVGFADQTHFTRVFKQCTGMTPGTYRARFAQ